MPGRIDGEGLMKGGSWAERREAADALHDPESFCEQWLHSMRPSARLHPTAPPGWPCAARLAADVARRRLPASSARGIRDEYVNTTTRPPPTLEVSPTSDFPLCSFKSIWHPGDVILLLWLLIYFPYYSRLRRLFALYNLKPAVLLKLR